MNPATTTTSNMAGPERDASPLLEDYPGALGFVLEALEGGGFAARLLVNPGRGHWLRKAGPVFLIQEHTGYSYAIAEQWVAAHHATAARALAAAEAVALANNGYADIGDDADLAASLQAAGFAVIRTSSLHGRPVFRAFTARAQSTLRREPFGVSTYKAPPAKLLPEHDYEAAILDRQERHLDGV
jgi:hypothetical protein